MALALSARFGPSAAQSPALRFADMHSHLGIIGGRVNLREAMAAAGMRVIARKISADAPVIRSSPRGISQVREPAPGELAKFFDSGLERLREQHRAEGLAEITSVEILDKVLAASQPAVVLAAEGGDFLEGDPRRLAAVRAQGLVHLQLVHYRINELGDISTARPERDGLTPFGKAVVAECNRLGILVDLAHGTRALIEQALDISTRPVVYSHSHVSSAEPGWMQNTLRARALWRPLAQRIAKQGGVVGIWPNAAVFPTLADYADALIETAGLLGADHVGVGTDMIGMPKSVIPAYAQFPELAGLLSRKGVKAGDVDALLGGNYLRVLRRALEPA